MMNDDMIRNIDYLKEKADISYEEAATLLERYDGNVMRVLVELERQGRIYDQPHASTGTDQAPPKAAPKPQPKNTETKDKAVKFINNAFAHHVVVEKGSGENKETVANLSAPYVLGASLIAPHLAIPSVALMFVMGYRVRIRKEKPGNITGNVEDMVDKAVTNIKKTASSFSETVRGEKAQEPAASKTEEPAKTASAPAEAPTEKHDDNDEGGEITVE